MSIFLEKQVTDGHKERAKQTCSDGQYDGQERKRTFSLYFVQYEVHLNKYVQSKQRHYTSCNQKGNLLWPPEAALSCKNSIKYLKFNFFTARHELMNGESAGNNAMLCAIWCHISNLKKHEKHERRSVTFSTFLLAEACNFTKINILHRCFSRFLNYANGTKSCIQGVKGF